MHTFVPSYGIENCLMLLIQIRIRYGDMAYRFYISDRYNQSKELLSNYSLAMTLFLLYCGCFFLMRVIRKRT